jgi:hypothetical protein
MPSDLTDNYVADTYKGILHVNGEELPANTRVQVYDGAGNTTALKLSNSVVECISVETQGLTASNLKYPESPGNLNEVVCQISNNVGADVLGLKSVQDLFCDAGLGATYKRTSSSRVPIFETKCGIVSGATDVAITDITGAAGGIDSNQSGNLLITNVAFTKGILTALAVKEVVSPIFKNLLINAQGIVNQRQIESGTSTTRTWNPKNCFLDRWILIDGTTAPIFADTNSFNGTVKTITIAGTTKVEQRIESINVVPGTHTLSWYGNAVATVLVGDSTVPVFQGDGSAGAGDLKYATFLISGGNVKIQFSGASKYFYLPKLERSSIRSEFDFREFGAELALCQRYFSKTYPYAVPPQTIYRPGAIQHHGVEPINPTSHNLQWRFPAEQPTGNTVWPFSPLIGNVNRFTVTGQLNSDEERDFRHHECIPQWNTSSVLALRRTGGDANEYPSGEMRLATVQYVADGEI